MEKLKIEYVDIESIKPYKKNAKLHPKEQIEQIKNSIEMFGMDDPIGIWKDEIVEGHGRLMACQELGKTINICCAIGDEYLGIDVEGEKEIEVVPYKEIVEIARKYIKKIDGFEKFAEWGLY